MYEEVLVNVIPEMKVKKTHIDSDAEEDNENEET